MSNQEYNIEILIKMLKAHKKSEERDFIDHIELTDMLHDTQIEYGESLGVVYPEGDHD